MSPTPDTLTQHETPPVKKTISFSLPAVSLPGVQSWVLILLIVVGLLQTAQLFGLNQRVVNANGVPSAAASTSTSSGSVTSSLPNMVGGC